MMKEVYVNGIYKIYKDGYKLMGVEMVFIS